MGYRILDLPLPRQTATKVRLKGKGNRLISNGGLISSHKRVHSLPPARGWPHRWGPEPHYEGVHTQDRLVRPELTNIGVSAPLFPFTHFHTLSHTSPPRIHKALGCSLNSPWDPYCEWLVRRTYCLETLLIRYPPFHLDRS